MATKNLIDGLNNFSTTLTGAITSSDTTIGLDSVADLPSAQGILVIDRVDSDGTATSLKREYIRYSSVTADSVVLDSAVVGRGFGGSSAQAHSAGAIVEMVMTAEHLNYLIDSYSVEHTDAGRHTFTDRAPIMNVKARAYLSADQDNITSSDFTKINLDSESYDIGSDFNVSTYKFVTPVAGYYIIMARVNFEGTELAANKIASVLVYVDGASVSRADCHISVDGVITASVSDIIYVAADKDIELYAYTNVIGNVVDIDGGEGRTFMAIHLLSQDA
jgi:hypothetical protein